MGASASDIPSGRQCSATGPVQAHHCAADLIRLFDECFADTENTRLVRGDDEPVYLPADSDTAYHRVVFAHGFFASALHEIAHWCIAGRARRQKVDYGYWYCPDGRSAAQQREFEKVEVKPQALEWIFSVAAGCRFRISVDNLNGEATDSTGFKRGVYEQVLRYCREGLNERAGRFRCALTTFYGTLAPLRPDSFDITHLP